MRMATSALTHPAGTAGRSGRSFRTISKRLTSSGNYNRSTRGPNTPGLRLPCSAINSAGLISQGRSTKPVDGLTSPAYRKNQTTRCWH